jgi:hypothetical protein
VACLHPARRFARIIARNGMSLVAEQCLSCGANVRGHGVWVPHHKLRVPLDSLPVLADYRSPANAPRQPGLFDAGAVRLETSP